LKQIITKKTGYRKCLALNFSVVFEMAV